MEGLRWPGLRHGARPHAWRWRRLVAAPPGLSRGSDRIGPASRRGTRRGRSPRFPSPPCACPRPRRPSSRAWAWTPWAPSPTCRASGTSPGASAADGRAAARPGPGPGAREALRAPPSAAPEPVDSPAWPSPSRSARRRTSPASRPTLRPCSARSWRRGVRAHAGSNWPSTASTARRAAASRRAFTWPAGDPDRLARLFAPKLEAVDPGFGIEVVTLTAGEAEPVGARQSEPRSGRPLPGSRRSWSC